MTTIELIEAAVEMLRGPDIVAGTVEIDIAVADLLAVLIVMHNATGIDLEHLPQVSNLAGVLLEDEA